MSTGGNSVSSDPMRIYRKVACFRPNPANEIPHVRHGIEGGNTLLVRKPILAGYGDHSQSRIALRVVMHPLRTPVLQPPPCNRTIAARGVALTGPPGMKMYVFSVVVPILL